MQRTERWSHDGVMVGIMIDPLGVTCESRIRLVVMLYRGEWTASAVQLDMME